MVRDLQIMKDISPLFDKKLVMWGMGQKGREILADILEMGAGQKGILLCDSAGNLQGEEILNQVVLTPQDMYDKIRNDAKEDVAFLVTAVSIKAQDEIIKDIEKMCDESVDIYTEFAIEWGIYLGLKNPNIKRVYKEKKLHEHEKNKLYKPDVSWRMKMVYKYFSFLPLHNDEIILIYQPGKVGSTTVYKSILNYNRHVLHCHRLESIGETDDSLLRLFELKSGKIISLVRDPVARQIAAMWQSITQVHQYSAEVDFSEIEEFFSQEGLLQEVLGGSMDR